MKQQTQTGYTKRGRAMFTDSFAPAEWSFFNLHETYYSGSADAVQH